MKILIEEVKDCEEVEIIIRCPMHCQDINKIVELLEHDDLKLQCKKGRDIYQIDITDIYYIETIDEKTFVYGQKEFYEVSKKLYELEDMLENHGFIRISKSCLLNLDYLDHIRALLNGKYEATLLNHEKLIISRKYMSDFKKAFER